MSGIVQPGLGHPLLTRIDSVVLVVTVIWMAAVIVGTGVLVAALTLFPARAGARRPVAAAAIRLR